MFVQKRQKSSQSFIRCRKKHHYSAIQQKALSENHLKQKSKPKRQLLSAEKLQTQN